jgi:hypothetical protein
MQRSGAPFRARDGWAVFEPWHTFRSTDACLNREAEALLSIMPVVFDCPLSGDPRSVPKVPARPTRLLTHWVTFREGSVRTLEVAVRGTSLFSQLLITKTPMTPGQLQTSMLRIRLRPGKSLIWGRECRACRAQEWDVER